MCGLPLFRILAVCYFSVCSHLCVYFVLCQNAGDTDYAVDIDESKLDVEDAILTKDVRGVIRPALKELKIAIVRRTSEFRRVQYSFFT